MSGAALSTLATFDDIRRCIQVLTDGTAEEEFLRVLRLQEQFRQECLDTAKEAQRIQKELDASLESMADLETKLYHARRLLEVESKLRREAEHERDQMEKKIIAVADLVQKDNNINNETRDKLAFLNTLPRKRKSMNRLVEEKYGNDINSTGSFLSDLSITQSEDDFLDVRPSTGWQKHHPSVPKNPIPCVGAKRSRASGAGLPSTPGATSRRSTTRRSGTGIQQHLLDVPPGADRICATTKVTIPQDGNGVIRAESTIESMPVIPITSTVALDKEASPEEANCITPTASPYKDATAPPITPMTAIKCAPGVNLCSPQVSSMRAQLMRHHNFASRTFIRTDTCTHCQKKIRFGTVGVRCRDCPVRCHADCRIALTVSCVPQSGTPTIKGMMGYISDYAPGVAPMVPALIVHCVNEIESRGLNEVGIYRVSGSEREVKALKERFLRGKNTPHLGNIDVHVLCGCVKDFLRSLREPLIPTNLWKDFCNAVQQPTEADIQKDLFKAIDALPQANRDTLAFLVLHFLRVAECREVLMPIDNIARVFGPTIVGYSSADPDRHAIFTEVYMQFTTMQNLLKIPGDYWAQFVTLDADKENNQTIGSTNTITRTPSHNKESLYSLYATPLKSTLKKRKFHATPPYQYKK
ncbi:rac GTPase-activating protein 1 [Rhagoletis pomonella]|uniref:rac GTPase-activating protein 1 n=1 Tax=Rhagoletis pomonella TaxID=28610 RepID=UPI0017825B66|nr:rac GTPase-activating protein 1 [Rhagoletis pomonella]